MTTYYFPYTVNMSVSADFVINRNYLDTQFEGYKLNATSLPICTKNILDGIDIVYPTDDQYSFIQQREYSIHDHIHCDPWDSLSVYYVNSEWKIKCFTVPSKEPINVEEPFEVWEIPNSKQRLVGRSNVTICFASNDLVALSDGGGTIFILSTGDRHQRSSKWKSLHFEEMEKPGRIVDAKSPNLGEVHMLFAYVDSKQTYLSHLHLKSSDGEQWKLERKRVIYGKSILDYAALALDCSVMYIVSQEELKSQELIDEEKKPVIENVKSFEWQQNYEEVKLWLDVECNKQPTIKVSASELTVTVPEKTLLKGQLYRPIEEGLTVWTLTNSKLEIVMSKRDEGTMWPKIFEVSDLHGKEISDPDLVAEIHSKLAHLTSEREDVGGATVLNSGQLEECDINDGDRRAFFAYDLSSATINSIHKVELGSGQWLMHGPRSLKGPPRFCIRSDVDGIVCEVTKEHKLSHTATICAFGFIQASKSSRIFSFFPADISYAGVVDAGGRIFLYKGGLRPGPKTSWGTQYVLSLADEERMLGIHASSHHIFLLSNHQLHVIGLSHS
ncbi:nudC domain-containing protein 1 [Halyomorpha halys]|uniref:nudC domain-containing protein 1 n=1 Tax=Halyomorpha halys TaxID=286706 RepID=UPI0006D52465|nr:nudC domain-containing protein 1-like [Halyomorpha halys]